MVVLFLFDQTVYEIIINHTHFENPTSDPVFNIVLAKSY